MPLSTFFADPRYRTERILLVTLVPIAVALLVAAGFYLYRQQTEGTKQDVAVVPVVPVVPKATPVPVFTPPPLTPEEQAHKSIAEADAAFAAGDVQRANEILRTVDLDKIDHPRGWLLLGLIQSALGNSPAARNAYTRGLATSPTADLYYRRALLYRDAQDYDKALADFNQAVALDPTNILAGNDRLLLLIQTGKKEQARTELTTIIQTSGTSTAWVFALCGLALEQNQFPEAAELLEHARKYMRPKDFHQLLGNPYLLRYQNQPEILPYFMDNTEPSRDVTIP